MDAYHEFDPRIGAVRAEFFEKNWVDAPAMQGKRVVLAAPPCHPAILSYGELSGNIRGVTTVNPRIGARGASISSPQTRGYLLANTGDIEAASVFGEISPLKNYCQKPPISLPAVP